MLILLWIIIALLGVILFVPFQYRFEWEHPEEGTEHEFSVAIGWLLGAVWFRVQKIADHEAEQSLLVFGYEKSFEAGDEEEESVREEEEDQEESTAAKSMRKAGKTFRKFSRYFGVSDVKNIIEKTLQTGWKILRPSVVKYDIVWGTGNPMYTGVMVGILHSTGVIRHIQGRARPDYIRATLTGRCYLGGRLVVGIALARVFALIFTIIFIGIRHRLHVIFSQRMHVVSTSK